MAREAIEVLKECEAFLEGHFLLSSGRHSGAYCQMAFLQQYPDRCAEVMAPVAEKLKELNVDVVVGPAMGGIVYAYELGRQLGKRAIFTERGGQCHDPQALPHPAGPALHHRRGRGHPPAFPAWRPSASSRRRAASAWASPAWWTAPGPRPPSPIPIVASALKLDLPNYAPEECPLCKEGKLPLVHLGSRKMKEAAKQTL